LSEGARQHVERIRSSAWHQLSIVEQLLSHARPLPADEDIVRETVDLRSVVNDVVELCAQDAGDKGLAVTTDVPAALTLRTDAGRLRQILINLMSNAVKYTRAGSISVHARGSDYGVFVEVSDTGPGIAEEALPRVFEPYWRGLRTTAGMGLGLSVSRKLARLLGGDLSVESTVGAGSTFTLKLPFE
jgi:signal transduction histidine kinase